MPATTFQFFFQAMTPVGGRMLGVRAATDEAALGEDLRREQLLLLKAWKLPIGAGAPPTLPLKDDAVLNEQLHILLSRGVPLVEALEVASSVVSTASKGRIERLREHVAAGASFSDACAKTGGFDAVTTAVYRSAERTGDLAGAAHRLAQSARRRLAIRGKALTVLIYPAAVAFIAGVVFLVLLMWLVPMMSGQMRQMKVKLNWFSEIVFSTGEWMGSHVGLTFALIGAAFVGAIAMRRQLGALALRTVGRIPAVARLLLATEMTRFFSVMAAMTRSGVTLAEALGTAGAVISDEKLRAQLRTLQKDLVEGGLWRTLIEKVDAMPLATRRLLVAAERAGDLDSAFDTLATDTAADVELRSARLLAMLEPGVIILMFSLIGPLIIAIAVPMLTFRTQGL